MSKNAPLLQVRDLSIEFPTRKRHVTVKAVNRVSFDVYPGETFGIIGESGSGKSTLGRALVSLVSATQGEILQDGVRPSLLGRKAMREHRRDFQILFQDPNAALNPRMRIVDSVMEPLEIQGQHDRSANRAAALEAMARVGLPLQFAERYPHQLSGGQKQRVIIARALTVKPRLIVCDEVVAALDVSIRGEVLNLFADLQREFGLTYVFITHDLSVVSHISDRIGVMYLGSLVEVGPATDFSQSPLHPYTQALLSAEPIPVPISMRDSKRQLLQGEIPSPMDLPSGCAFRTRCPKADDRCAKTPPTLAEHRPGHWVACHFAQA